MSRPLSFLLGFDDLRSLLLSDDLALEEPSSDWLLHDVIDHFRRAQTPRTGAMVLYMGAQAQKILVAICRMSKNAFALFSSDEPKSASTDVIVHGVADGKGSYLRPLSFGVP